MERLNSPEEQAWHELLEALQAIIECAGFRQLPGYAGELTGEAQLGADFGQGCSQRRHAPGA